jgi:SpoVK/Ycf46/Vps4 family AAA+-type ATPase
MGQADMATAEQIKFLIQSHFESDDVRFTTLALQVAAQEARNGHLQLSQEIRLLIDKAKDRQAKIIPFRPDLSELVLVDHDLPQRLSDVIVSESTLERLKRVLLEYRQQHKLKNHGLIHRRKLMLCGPSGCGKTLTASVIAGELELPLCIILMDRLVTKFMGETSAKLRQIFDAIANRRGVYLFDEFDAIGAERNLENDVGEIRRVLNTFLQMIERDQSDSLIIAATNNHSMLDQALFRRFDDVITYELPNDEERARLLATRLGTFRGKTAMKALVKASKGLSHAEITLAVQDAIKQSVLADASVVSPNVLGSMLRERHNGRRRSKGR